ncbi:hypothetical protein [Rhizobium sp. BK176]|uniref:hypothetical protein n=1 Tax=Rhizobium sp. BK176 TaxID=2587071 RepID=UPI0021685370|nr:hypothetical protein [Rhizobium sp. BK176]MCS4088806.1 hypothetical protein [Rhizobium sp. BK176]
MRTVADLTDAEITKETEQAIALVEGAVNDLRDTPRNLAELALMAAVANWNVSTESFSFLKGRCIHDLRTIDPRLEAAHEVMETFAVANGLDLDSFKRPTIAYLRKLTEVEPWQASVALLPLLNDPVQSKAVSVAAEITLEIAHWLDLAAKNEGEMRKWLALARETACFMTPDFPVQAEQFAELEKKYLDRALARS